MGQPAARCSTRADVEPMTRVAPSTARPWWRAVVLLVVVAMVSAGFAAAEPAGAAVEGPGGPILVVSSAVHPFSEYYVEILRNEGLNAFDAVDITSLTPATLAAHDVVVLGEIPIDASQAAMLAAWVDDGGNLIAMRPDPDLASLVGVTDTGADLAEGYLQIDTAAGTPGAGLVGADDPVPRHRGPLRPRRRDRRRRHPVVRRVHRHHQSGRHPAQRRLERRPGGRVRLRPRPLRRVHPPGQPGLGRPGARRPAAPDPRSDDLFFPDWIDLDKVQIPQADEQQRLLANVIEHANRDVMPLPRFWYFPRGERAVVVMTGDDHASSGGTAGQFDWAIGASPPGCVVDEWQCVRGTSYVYPSTPLSDAAAAAYEAQGFEVAAHVTTNCADWTPGQPGGVLRRPADGVRRGVPQPRPADDQPHPLHHLERLGDAPEDRAGRGHPPRHELLLLAGVVGEQPTRVLHRAPACRCASPTSTAP